MLMKELCVVFGGRSPEHEISRKSVTSVLANLDKSKYNISLIGITKDGAWYLYTGDYANIENGVFRASFYYIEFAAGRLG